VRGAVACALTPALLTAALAVGLLSAAAPVPAPPPDGIFRPWAGVPTRGDYTLYVSAVHDGDTFDGCLLVPLKVRVFAINAPELPTPEGKAARDYLDKLIRGKLLPARLYGPDKYGGRTLGDVAIDGAWAGDLMIRAGMAKPYDGHGPRP
jgi:endonuclease YncB( thermonuclease family)